MFSSKEMYIQECSMKDHQNAFYTTLSNFSTKYLMMYKVYTDVGGTVFVHLYTR